MLTKIDTSTKKGHGPIRILYPGLTLHDRDTGLATIGRIDHATIPAGALIAMHPHINDEILTYLRHGRVEHNDSAGLVDSITPRRLMLMKAGRRFSHEEQVMEDGGQLEGLQIFIRPEEKDLEPQVAFYDLPEVHSQNEWRLLAGRGDSGAPLTLRSSTWIYYVRLTADSPSRLPNLPEEDLSCLLYVFEGTASVDDVVLEKGDSLLIEDESDVEIRSGGRIWCCSLRTREVRTTTAACSAETSIRRRGRGDGSRPTTGPCRERVRDGSDSHSKGANDETIGGRGDPHKPRPRGVGSG